MVDKRKSEQGYALLVVVLVVALIMVLFTTFMTMSLNTANQERIVDEKNLTVAAAEMGVEYYTSVLNNIYLNLVEDELEPLVNNKIADLVKLVEESTEEEIDIDTEWENGKIQKDVGKELAKRLQEELIKEDHGYKFRLPRDVFSSYQYSTVELFEIKYNEEKRVVEVTGDILGKNTTTEEERNLDFQQFFEIPDFQSFIASAVGSAVSGGGESNIIKDIEEELGKNDLSDLLNHKCTLASGWISGKECSPTNFSNSTNQIANSKIYFPADYSISDGFTVQSNAKIDVDGKLSVGSFNLNGSTVTANNNLEVNKGDFNFNSGTNRVVVGHDVNVHEGNLNMSNNANLMVGNDLNLYNTDFQMHTSNTRILVGNDFYLPNGTLMMSNKAELTIGNDLIVNKNINLTVDAAIIIGGDLNIKNSTIMMTNQSKICINGDLNATNVTLGVNEYNDSKIYVNGNINGIVNPNANQITNKKEEVEGKCDFPVNEGSPNVELPNVNGLDWGEKPDVTVTY